MRPLARNRPRLGHFKDAAIALGTPGSAADPRCNADPSGTVKATVEFFSNSSGATSQPIELPCENWDTIGPDDAPRGYKYKDKTLGDGPCKNVLVRAGKIVKATCFGKGAGGFDYDLEVAQDQGIVNVVLTIGTTKYCTAFDDAGNDGSDGKKFQGKDNPTPTSCSVS